MPQDNRFHIRLNVYDTPFSVTIPREDEVFYRNAAKLITDTVNNYASVYKGRKTEKEVLFMAFIDIALRYEKELGRNDTRPYDSLLSKLTSEIEEALK